MMNSAATPSTFSRSRVWRGIIWTVIVVVVGVGSLGVVRAMRQQPRRQAIAPLALRVKVQQVQPRQRQLFLTGYGTTQALQRLNLVAEIGGKVVYAYGGLKPGTFVRRGKLLLRLDTQSYRLEHRLQQEQIKGLKKQLRSAQKALQLARRNRKRIQTLYRRRATDRGTLDNVTRQLLDRQQRVEALEQTLQMTRVKHRLTSLKVRRGRLRAPFDARIVSGGVAPGTYVAPGRTIAVLESAGGVELPVSFPLATLQSLRDNKGRPLALDQLPSYLEQLPPVEIRLPYPGSPVWQGRVVRVGARVDDRTRTVPLWVQIDRLQPSRQQDTPRPKRLHRRASRHSASSGQTLRRKSLRRKGLQRFKRRAGSSKKGALQARDRHLGGLLSGVFCQVRIPTQKIAGAVRLPLAALYKGKVYVVHQGRLASRQVKVVHRDAEQVLVTGSLRQGDRVVISPLKHPLEGLKVVVAACLREGADKDQQRSGKLLACDA